jgi:hypothetical protein
MFHILRSRVTVAVASAAFTAALVGGVAYAAAVASPIDGAGVIHGCYNPSTGAVKLLTKPSCPTTGAKTPISWNSQGVQGIQGVKGDNGAQGLPGASGGLSGFQRVGGEPITLQPGAFDYFSVSCPSGEVAVGGGYETSLGVVINDSWPSGGAAWTVHARNPGTSDETLRVFATCAIATP